MKAFLANVEARCSQVLQSNETIDLFKDEFKEFEEEEVICFFCCALGSHACHLCASRLTFIVPTLAQTHIKYATCAQVSLGNRAENNLKELHSFTDLIHSKNKNISAICWHPSIAGEVAFACTNNLTFDQWVEVSGKVLSSSILIWNFQVPESIRSVMHRCPLFVCYPCFASSCCHIVLQPYPFMIAGPFASSTDPGSSG